MKATPDDNKQALFAMVQNIKEDLARLEDQARKARYMTAETAASNIAKYALQAAVYAARLEK